MAIGRRQFCHLMGRFSEQIASPRTTPGPLWGPKPSERPPKRTCLTVMDSRLEAIGPSKDGAEVNAKATE